MKSNLLEVTTFTILTDCIRAAILTNDISTLGRLLMLNLFPETTQVGGPHYILPFSQLEYYGFLMMSLYWERYEAAILIHGLLFRCLFDDKTLQDIGDRLNEVSDFKSVQDLYYTVSDYSDFTKDSVLTKVKEAVAQLQQVAKTTELTQEQNPPANWSLKSDLPTTGGNRSPTTPAIQTTSLPNSQAASNRQRPVGESSSRPPMSEWERLSQPSPH
ncbi:hypothetical protein H4R33_006912 [Dimargaris cristalligena]|nr:hypothetical protein H4R33_006912 [Dimargaris cristalligena]